MNSLTMDHVLLTRFNVPSAGRESLIRAKEGWLKDRVALFERYCLPSVQRQTTQKFHWIIYFDPQSPQWLHEWIQALAQHRIFTPIFRESVSREDLLSDLRNTCGGHGDVLITTNLDNDDALALDCVQRIQDVVRNRERKAIYLADGLILHESKVYERHDRDNAFCSVAEPWEEPVTAWADWHNRLNLHMPASVISGAPAWIQVIHGTNVSNRVHGRLTQPTRHRANFAKALDNLPDPNALQFAAENFLVRPVRVLSARVRSLAKSVVLSLGGREGLERLRDTITSMRHRIRHVLSAATSIRPGQSGGQGAER